MGRLLVVTAVPAERDAIVDACPGLPVLVTGVGPVAAAAVTSAQLARDPVELLICAGIAGGFAPLQAGDIAVASMSVFADLGVQSADAFVPLSVLGYGDERYPVPAQLAVELSDRTGGHMGTVLTVATVCGTTARADELRGRFPDAVAEGMEGAGVAAAAAVHGVAFGEVRAISNPVGPRRRAEWRIAEALHALGRALAAVAGGGLP
jgi:futalosine hydrolase